MKVFLVIVSVFSICSSLGYSNLDNYSNLSIPKTYSKVIYLENGLVFIK